MKVKVQEDRKVYCINTAGTQNENNATELEIVVPEQYQDFNKKIVFITDKGVVWDIIENNTYKITNAITKYKSVEFYIWLTKGTEDFRSETKTLRLNKNLDPNGEITEEEIGGVNKVINILEEEIEKVNNLDIDITKSGDNTKIIIKRKDGTTKEVIVTGGGGISYDDTEVRKLIAQNIEAIEMLNNDKASISDMTNYIEAHKEELKGTNGKSAFEIAVEKGFEGTEEEWLASLKGRDGIDGKDGQNGADGQNGKDGIDGKSAYEIWLELGNEGTEEDFIASLKGEQGQQGEPRS